MNPIKIKAVATTQIYENKNREYTHGTYGALILTQAERTKEWTFYRYRLRLEDELMVSEPQHSDYHIPVETDIQAHFWPLQLALEDLKRRRDVLLQNLDVYHGCNLKIVSPCKDFLQCLASMINEPIRGLPFFAPNIYEVLRTFETIQTVLIGNEDAESMSNAGAFLIE